MRRTSRNRKQQRKRRLIILLSIGLVLLLALIYLLISLYFKNHFYFHTEINGLKVGRMTAEEAKDKIAADVGDYLLTVYDRDGEKYHIMGKEIDNHYLPDGSLEKALSEQNMFHWIPSLFQENRIDVDTPMTFDAQKLKEAVAALPCFAEENVTKPVDAVLKRGENGYEIVPEVLGNELILEKVVEAVEAAVTEGEGTVTLTDDAYRKPEIFSDNETLVKAKKQIDDVIAAEVSYQISDYDEKLSSEEIFKMLSVDENYHCSLDEKQLTDFVQRLASKYNTYADEREFATSSGDTKR